MSIESYKRLMKSIEYLLKVKCLKFGLFDKWLSHRPFAGVTQLAECEICNFDVASSSLAFSSNGEVGSSNLPQTTNSQMAICSFLLERIVSL